MIKKTIYLIQSVIVYFFFLISKIIGLKLSRVLFAFIFFKIGSFFRSNKIIEKNLKKINPNLTKEERDLITKKMWNNYGKTFIEYAHLNTLRKKTDDILKKKKPVVFVSGHFANFELMSMELSKANIKLATIYRPLNNIFLNPFMEYIRKKFICANQIKKGLNGVKEALNFMHNDYCIALMVDQRVSEGSIVPFFEFDALTTTLPAQFSKKFNCDIVPIYISRNEKDGFIMEIQNPLKFSDEPSNNKEFISQKINEVIEKLILKDPSQWILTHNRWK